MFILANNFCDILNFNLNNYNSTELNQNFMILLVRLCKGMLKHFVLFVLSPENYFLKCNPPWKIYNAFIVNR